MRISTEFVKFILAGIVNVLLTFAVYFALVSIATPYTLANALAWVLGIAFSYFLNSTFVFRKVHRKKTASIKQFVFFSAAYFVNFLISSFLLVFLVEANLFDPVRAQYIVIPVVVFLNYSASKLFVFRSHQSKVPKGCDLKVQSCIKEDL